MSGLFSQNNPLLCGMQGNKALLGKKSKKLKSMYIQPVLTFDKSQICNASSCRVFEHFNKIKNL